MIGDAIIITTDGMSDPEQPDTIARALTADFAIVGFWTRHSGGISASATTYVVLKKHLTGQDGGIADIRAAQVPPKKWFE